MPRWFPLPLEVCSLVERSLGAVLLQDARPGAQSAISRLFLSPERCLTACTPHQLPALFDAIENTTRRGGCAAGFFTYECGAAFEPAAAPSAPFVSSTPLAWFGLYERSFDFDHQTGAFAHGNPPGLASLHPPDLQAPPPQIEPGPGPAPEDFAASIDAIHQWIRAGDVYQLNFTYPLRLRLDCGPATLYAHLLRNQPAPYAALLHWQPGHHILSLSPELFFRVDEEGSARRITTRPMKGTAPRGRTAAEDRNLAEQLRHDEKNRAENVMIVDLLRNDLGRLCRFGTVETQNLFAVERYPTLWQMTSTVTGLLRDGVRYHEMLRALFPCGSITGAPKVRAMQLLAQLEGRSRGVYTGAIGFFSPQCTVFNVAIRTLEMQGVEATIGVGSGIVIDSRAEDEFRECRLKAEFLTSLQEPFSLIETLLWHDGFPFLDFHLGRLRDSAEYFDFPCDTGGIRDALLAAAAEFSQPAPQRVRLLLHSSGQLHIEAEPFSPPASDALPLRVTISSEHTDPRDRFLYHKTTRRPLYARAFQAARAAGFADVLFLNRDKQLTEGAISNVFIEKDSRWFTPPVACGLLPGVYRRHLLATQPGIEERVLTLDDLKTADAIYLANAVRGLRRVSVTWQA
jgi:para-aminobenzoate synthetase / 4-amino-4-deoxychorismate lyase